MRIDKFISSQRTDLSRGDVKKLIRAGRVTADGAVVKSPEHKVSETAEVAVDGEVITYKEHIYLMLNKPQGYVCSAKEGSSPTVYELVPPQFRRRGLFPAGRLDKDTVGFVLMTDDGQLAHEMLSPVHHVPKTYIVTLEDPYREDYENSFAEGLVIDGGDEDVQKRHIVGQSHTSCFTQGLGHFLTQPAVPALVALFFFFLKGSGINRYIAEHGDSPACYTSMAPSS